MEVVINWIVANKVVLLTLLLALSEVLALIPAVKANSVAQAIFNGIKWAYDKFTAKTV
jgi:hypothetical protein